MSALQTLLNSAIVYRIGITLLHSLWQGAAILALLSLVLLITRKTSPQKRYALASAAMLLLIAAPILTFSLMNGSGIPPATWDVQPKASNIVDVQSTPVAAMESNSPMPINLDGAGNATSPTRQSFIERYAAALPWLVIAWLAGVVCLALWNFGGWIALQQMRFVTTQRAGEDAEQTVRMLSRRLGIAKPVCVLTSTLARTPMVIGALKPVILLPACALTELSIAELESIIAHELAHIRRHDFVINLLQAVVETILFYHPAVWLISARVRQERENCCDDLALSVTRDRASYVRALAAVASVRVTSLVPAASGGRLLPRLQRLLGVADASVAKPSRWSAGAIVLTLIISAALFTRSHGQTADANSDDDIVWIHGQVLDPDGKPVAGAKVMTTGYSFKAPISQSTSEADGAYKISYKRSVFADVRFGGDKTLMVAATAPGFGPGWAKPSLAKEAGEVTLRLATDDVPVEGRIIDLEGRPVSNITVRVWSIHEKYSDLSRLTINGGDPTAGPDDLPDLDALVLGPTRYTHTDADGRFKVTGVGRDRTIDLVVHGPGIANGFIRLNTRPGPKQTRTFQMYLQMTQTVYGPKFEYIAAPGRAVRGTIRDAQTHEPLAGVHLENGSVEVSAITDERGNYQIDGYSQQQQWIGLTAIPADTQPYLMGDADVPIKAGSDPITVDFELHRGVFITGKITSMTTAKPARSMEIQYRPLLTNNAAQGLPEYRGRQAPGRYERYYSKGDGTFRIVGLPGQGIVFARDGGGGDPFCRGAGTEFLKCPLTRDGKLAVFGGLVAPTDYIAAADVQIPAGQTSSTLDLQCNPGVIVHAKIVDPEGKPVSETKIGGSALPMRRATPDSIDLLAIGPKEAREIAVTDKERRLGRIVKITAKDAANPTYKIRLQPVSTLTGRVIGRDGQPITKALVEGAVNDVVQTGTDADGRFALTVIPGRPCNLRGIKGVNQFLTDVENLVIPPGETKDLGDVHVK